MSLAEIAPICDSTDFTVANFIQQGGAGKVYEGVWHSVSPPKKVAFKFFGYTDREPHEQQIYEEIDLMQTLRGIEGLVQLQATFMDPPWGMVSGKYFRRCYPCIVMELLEGGELFEKIESTGAISENDLALVFREIIIALDSMHRRRYLHRDVKLENLMLVNKSPNSPVKIIDFGMMVRLKKGKSYYRSSTIQGTAGYVAPESLLYAQYSAASDIWQAGICLYSMLSGFAPFHPKHPEQITELTYFPMVGLGWDGISDAAKDLVAKILVKNPEDRIKASEILNHPWVTTEKAPTQVLGTDYSMRIKHLAIRQKMKTFFVENNLQEYRVKRDNLKILLPNFQSEQSNNGFICFPSDEDSFLTDTTTNTSFLRSSSTDSGTSSSAEEFSGKLRTLKNVMIQRFADRNETSFLCDVSIDCMSPLGVIQGDDQRQGRDSEFSGGFNLEVDLELSFDPEDFSRPESSNGMETMISSSCNGSCGKSWEIDCATFINMMTECELFELANPQVFAIFDSQGNGKISTKDVLLTLLSFRYQSGSSPNEENYKDIMENSARLFFNLFDINDSGSIGIEELKIVMGCILQDESLPVQLTSPTKNSSYPLASIDDLFQAVDINKDGRIDFEEFRVFYEAVLTYSTTRRSLSVLQLPILPQTTI